MTTAHDQDNNKPHCTTRGLLRGGRAMCGQVIVGGKFCGAPRGTCNLQEGARPGEADGRLQVDQNSTEKPTPP